MKKWMLRVFALAVLPGNGLNAQTPASQAPNVLDRQAAVGSRMKFDVASVKENKIDLPERPYSSFPMGLGDMYSSNGGHLIARNWPFAVYLQFAYKMTDGQLEATMGPMPDWTKTARFDIEAKVEGDPTKDQMRLMMQSLLAERFKLSIHHETQQVRVFVLVLAKPGKTGPKLVSHPTGDTSCSNGPSVLPAPGSAPVVPRTVAGGFPVTCDVLASLPPSSPGRIAWGYRNATMAVIASQMMSFGMLDRPVIDQTGLTGTFDFRIEFAPEWPSSVILPPDLEASGPTFLEALRVQDGLKMISQKHPLDVIVVDHVEHPSEN
jgi:uncharacterized protein (TIGR03435 family)